MPIPQHEPRITGVVFTDPPIGEVIPGSRYRLLSKIGEGGMGLVYAAMHVDLEKKVALKILRPDPVLDGRSVERFRREARTASKIGSPYICDVTDFGELPDGRVFFVMEFLDGPSVGRLLRSGEKFTVARALPILRQMAKALGASHEQGVVHLDVKPDNVVLLKKGNRKDGVKVVDFGIAGLLSESAGDQKVISGTAAYVAPERAVGRAFDHRCDIYALGIVGYELLTGSPPFLGRDAVATLTMQVKDPPLPLSHVVPGKVPAAVEKALLKLLEKDPDARPQTMAEVEALLCEAQIAAGVTTAWDDLELPAVDEEWRRSLAERMPAPWSRKRKLITGTAVAVAGVGIATALYFGVFREPKIVFKQVRVAETQTDELPGVAAKLVKAAEAVRRYHYVRPPGESALDFLEGAEAEAQRLGGKSSRGAKLLRAAYGSSLAAIGDELRKVRLLDLAMVKYEEALLFLPEDAQLLTKVEELRRGDDGAGKPGMRPRPVVRGARTKSDEAKTLAADAFAAARVGKLNDARTALRELGTVDPRGEEAGRVAEGVRALARQRWDEGKRDEARPLYQLLTQLDARDAEAKERSATAAATPPPAATAAVAPVIAEPAPAEAKPSAQAANRRTRAPAPEADVPEDVPRDRVASRAATEQGNLAMQRAQLTQAEAAFNRAVRADPLNSSAIAGLASVAFERARYAEALDYARRAARLAPKSAQYQMLLGDALFKLLRFDDALDAYQKARALKAPASEIDGRIARVRAKLQ